ncbi:MAG: lysophospholipid acyltransferase family protein [Pseudomonadota bacterium]
MQYLRSLIFNVAMYVWMPILGIVFAPWAILSPEGARTACNTYARHVIRMMDVLLGLRIEVRGAVPSGEVLVAAKHQSFADIIVIWDALSRPFFIMKALLRFAPVLGQYALRLGCIPVHRGKRTEAIKSMLAEVRSGKRAGGQLLIYPQGTRVAPGTRRPYKVGTFALYEQMQQPCVPVATNIGLFWPKRGFLRHPGLGVIEFLDPIPPGLPRAEFMAAMETAIEEGSNRLMAEAGFPIDGNDPPLGDPVAMASKSAAQNR